MSKRVVVLDEQTVELEIDERSADARVRIGSGEWRSLHLQPVGLDAEGMYIVILNNRPYVVSLTPSSEGFDVTVRGRLRAAITDQRKIRQRIRETGGGSGGPSGPVTIKSAITGMVVDVLVRTGAEVAQGETVLTIEAMKMQNEVKTPRAGIVSSIQVGKGDRVERGAPLVVIDPPQS